MDKHIPASSKASDSNGHGVSWNVTSMSSANLKSLNENGEQIPTFDAYSSFSTSARSHASSVSSASLLPGISANGSSLRSSLTDVSSVQSSIQASAANLSRTRSNHLPSVSTVGLFQIKRGSATNHQYHNLGNDPNVTRKSMESVSVTNTYEKLVYKLVTIVVENNATIKCTPEQLFWIVGKGVCVYVYV